jgi:hypothetical protein
LPAWQPPTQTANSHDKHAAFHIRDRGFKAISPSRGEHAARDGLVKIIRSRRDVAAMSPPAHNRSAGDGEHD